MFRTNPNTPAVYLPVSRLDEIAIAAGRGQEERQARAQAWADREAVRRGVQS